MGNAMTWIILGLIVAMVVVMFLNSSRQKKQEQEAQKMVSELKVGDKVKTYIGVFGKIVSITETTDGKVCVIETGDKIKTQIELDMRAVAGLDTKQIAVYDENNNLISLDGKPVPKQEIAEAKVENKKNKKAKKEKTEIVSEMKTEDVTSEEKKEEAPVEEVKEMVAEAQEEKKDQE